MPRVALVYPYFRTRAPTEMLFNPLGVAILAAHLRGLGIETRVFDCTFATFGQLQESLRAYQPEIVGIYCMVTMSRNAFSIAEAVRADLPNCLLVAGGPLPTLYPERFCQQFDVVFRGEANLSFPRFCQNFLQLDVHSRLRLVELPLDGYPGLFVRRDGIGIDNPAVHYPERELDSFPLPDRRDFDHAAYQWAGIQRDGAKTTSILLTYGCPFDCDFCSRPVFGKLFRRRNLDGVLEEIEQVRRLGYDSLWIADDNFTLDSKYLRAFCEVLIRRRIRWSCLSRVTGLNVEIARVMQEAGCRRVYLGLESGSQDTLNLMKKRATLEEGIEAVRLFHEVGIEVAAFFIVGYPGETNSSIEQTFQLALTLPLAEISFNVPFPLPGSALFERVGGIDPNKDWDKENEVTFVYSSEFDEVWLRTRIDETMRLFADKK